MPPQTRNKKRDDQNSESSEDEQRRAEDIDPAAARSQSALAPTTPPPAPAAEARRDNTIAITEDQLARLITNVMRNVSVATSPLNQTPTPSPSCAFPPAPPAGNFSRCTARFDGVSRSADEFEAFIDAISVYKECTTISDEHALRGLALLLTDQAAVFWRGVKSSITSWEDAVRRLRAMYGAPRPPHKVFRDIFAQEQSVDDRSELFISRVRAKFAQLPYEVPVTMQTDMIYGMLHRKIRKRLPRDSVMDPDQLLERARYVEDSLSEVNNVILSNAPGVAMHANSHSNNVLNTNCAKVNPSTAHVYNFNPLSADVRTFTHAPSSSNTRSATDPRTITEPSTNVSRKRDRPRCSACRRFGHIADDCRSTPKAVPNKNAGSVNPSTSERGNSLYCYGCGKPGTVRSKCETCASNSKDKYPNSKTEFQNIEIGCLDASRPIVRIKVAGREGVAVLDTGATHSIASPGLYAILVASNVKFTATHRAIGLADGTQQVRRALTCETMVILQGRSVLTKFLVLPGANNRTLLGRDFIVCAGVMLDLPQGIWCFADARDVKFTFVESYELHPPVLPSAADAVMMQIDDAESLKLREDEGYTLTPTQRIELNQLIVSRAGRFALEGPPTTYAIHRIRVDDAQEPVASPPYRLSQNRKEVLDLELQKLLQAGIIEECESPWAANVVLVPKRDGGLRLCVDYRKLNAVTEPDRYPLPRIEDVLHAAKTTSYMSTLDLQSGYFQVSVAEEDRDKTSFITPSGTFRFKRMPMGLRNSGATFQRLIDRLKSNLFVGKQTASMEAETGVPLNHQSGRPVSILAYLDDLIILSETYEQHLEDLEAVLDRLKLFNLRINRKKSSFACDAVKFLGHIIVPGGLRVDPEKTAAIVEMAPPKNVRQVKSFVAMTSWFRRFIPDFASVARPLTNLLKKNSIWEWREEQHTAFEKIKRLLVAAPILRQADESKPFTIRTDSSGYCLGAVLMQGEGPDERPVEYASRLLEPAERNYNTTEREALAVVWAVTKFRGYIEGSEVVVKSDHQPLRWLMSLKSPSGRLARWALTLQAYNLKIEYTPGKSNVIADALSRPACCEEDSAPCEVCEVVVDVPHRDAVDTRDNQRRDPELRTIIDDMEADDVDFRGRGWSNRGYILSDGVLYRYGPEADGDDAACLVIPQHERQQVLSDFHNAPTAGHLGVDRTYQRLSTRYYWPGMKASVIEHVKSCADCQRYKADNRKPAGLLQTPAPARRFEVVSVDLFGPLPKTANDNRWILIVEDVCSRWVELFALEAATSAECAKVLTEEVFLRYGVPRRMISDNGVQFVGAVMQQACHALGIKQNLTPLYHPQANPIERKNRDLKPQLAVLVGQDHATWDTHLAAVRFAMNSAVTASTGYSPAYLTFGRELRAPADVLSDMKTIMDSETVPTALTPYLRSLSTRLLEARDIHEKAQTRSKQFADEGRRPAPDYNVGDYVLLKTQGLNDVDRGQTAKFIPRRDGPYKVTKMVSPSSFELENPATGKCLGKYHVSHITPYVGDVTPPVKGKRRRGRPRKLRHLSPNARAQCSD